MADREITWDQLNRTRRLLEERWKALGYDGLHQFERDWIVTWWLKVETENGSFHQYFFNSAGDGAPQALAALERLDQSETHRILSDALACFGPAGYSPVRAERQRRLAKLPDDVFDVPTRAFYNRSEDFDLRALLEVLLEYERLGIHQSGPSAAPAQSREVGPRGS
jgi:hypothetical protein